jgi:hypothetical protein
MYSGEYNVFHVTLSVYPHGAGWKVSLTTVGIEPATFGVLVQSIKKIMIMNKNIMIIEHIGIEGTRLSSEIPHTRTDLAS